jgi:hypothetical protein
MTKTCQAQDLEVGDQFWDLEIYECTVTRTPEVWVDGDLEQIADVWVVYTDDDGSVVEDLLVFTADDSVAVTGHTDNIPHPTFS